MEIITLVKAGIRNRKGIFIGFTLLTALIVTSVVTMIGVKKNYKDATKNAFETVGKGTIMACYNNEVFTDALKEKLENNEAVDHLLVIDSITAINTSCNNVKDGNGYYVVKQQEGVPVFNAEGTAFVNGVTLSEGEVFLPYGSKDLFHCKEGDTIQMEFLGQTREFTIKAFVQEPFMGTAIMGVKTVFLNDSDFDEIRKNCLSLIESDADNWSVGNMVYIYPSDQADSSSNKMLRKLNLDTKFDDLSKITTTRETAEHYTGIFINIFLAVITGFAVLLTIIFLIVAGHNISSELEIDYTNLGILKAEGFTNKSIRKVYLAEYLLVQFIGIVIGFLISVPFERWLSRLYFAMTAILPMRKLPILEGLALAALLFLVTGIFIFLFTGKVAKTTPVKAIARGKNDVYFSGRLNAPITKRGLGFSLGFRQITSAPKRYISIFLVSALLIFTVISVDLMSDYISSRDALTSMGEPFTDIDFAPTDNYDSFHVADVEAIIEQYAHITGRCYKSHRYLSVNGENVLCIVKAYPEELSSVYKGRDVQYDNEVVITEQIADLLDVKIGDTVTLGMNEQNREYIVVGIFQTMTDMGKAISLSLDGLSMLRKDPTDKFTADDLNMYKVTLNDTSRANEIVSAIQAKYGEDIAVEFNDFNAGSTDNTENFYVAADVSKIMIYVLTFIFAFVTVTMVCTKTFIQERTDIGIERAVGFSVGRIRRQFAVRFMMIGVFSAALGVLLSILFSSTMLSAIFSMFGVPHMELSYSFLSVAGPILAFAILYMIFGYLASAKVKKVSARELITE